ncbi:transposase InsO family protein [Kitasatospora sp. GAS1066B]
MPGRTSCGDEELKELIQKVYHANYRVYGARKIWRELGRQGHAVARCTVERLMRELGITSAVRGKKVISTIADPVAERAPDPYDNALMESTIGLLKTELIKPRRRWRTLSQVELATAERARTCGPSYRTRPHHGGGLVPRRPEHQGHRGPDGGFDRHDLAAPGGLGREQA